MLDHEDQDSNFDAEEAVRVLRTNTISPKSRDVYDGSIAQMLIWFYDNKRQLLTEQFVQYGITDGFSKASIRRFLADAPSNAPVKFKDFNVQDFMEWIVSHMHSLAKNVNDVVPQIQKLAPDVIRGVIVEKRAMTAGTVTRDGFEALINGCLEKSGLYQLVQKLEDSPTSGIQQEETLTGDEAVTMTHMVGMHSWGGRLHLVPQDFAFPNSWSQIAWQYWMCGDRQKQYPPLRILSKNDMSNTNMQKRLSDFRYLMQLVEKRVEEKGKWIAHPSIEQANEMFEAGKDVLDISEVSEKGRKRRGEQMKWSTMVNRVRNKRKTQRTS
ncbi:hypothetical protein IV203_037128 [Nitzschia inconspicua]|uniref:Uncharacterized protein n=1 Tax=Nitzschia inconspicua TaxID=303405 RepID=A0A9K3PYA7_9STRA|nr:hypothetical protein IV203_037128 [Nitzschia inconspicua]